MQDRKALASRSDTAPYAGGAARIGVHRPIAKLGEDQRLERIHICAHLGDTPHF